MPYDTVDSVLLVDDDPEIRRMDRRILETLGLSVIEADSCAGARQRIQADRPLLVLLDIQLPDGDGRQLCRSVKDDPDLRETFVVLISGVRKSSADAVDGFAAGADGYIRRPIERQEFASMIQAFVRTAISERQIRSMNLDLENRVAEQTRSLRLTNDILQREIEERKQIQASLKAALKENERLRKRLELENRYLKQRQAQIEGSYRFVGQSPSIRHLLEKVRQVASTDTTVLITGETGTGKEILAHILHEMSARAERVMVTVNCAAIPLTLFESELFGREKGAYTGALTRQIGRFEIADGSSLFLDEISELQMEVQAKLLRVLEDGRFERLGSTTSRHANVRIIAATNRNLEAMVEEGTFRKDLYYRLNVFPLHVPPLRERVEDIPLLTWHFVEELSEHMGKRIDRVPEAVMNRLKAYRWPGNVRELRNVIERAMIQASSPTLDIDLPDASFSEAQHSPSPRFSSIDDVQKAHILEALHRSRWRIRGPRGAAVLLGIKPTTLESRMKRLGISRH